MLALRLVDVVQLIGICTKYVGGTEDVRRVIVETEFVIYDAMVDVVGFEEMFQGSCSSLRLLLDFVDLGFGELDGLGGAEIGEEGKHNGGLH